jgi:hypothetical protein
MTDIVVCLTNNVGLNHVKDLIEKNQWEKILIITTEKLVGEINFSCETMIVIIDLNQTTETLVKDLVDKLKGNISGLEIALNLFSGAGKEHMAILSALLKLGIGIRLVKQGKEKVEEV